MLWTMLKPLDSNVRQILGTKLLDSVKTEKERQMSIKNLSEKIKAYRVSPFIESLPVKGGLTVPANENGRDALIELKYNI